LIAIGYVVAPLAGWFPTVAYALWRSGFSPYAVQPSLIMMALGGIGGLVLELVVVTPLLRGFDRYRWPWFNGWTGAALGFALGASIWFLLMGCLLGGLAPAEVEGGIEALRMETAGEVTARSIHATAIFGTAGLISAAVFRGIAVRRAR
jgi:hypothetical protein